MLREVRLSLLRIPFEAHGYIVCTSCTSSKLRWKKYPALTRGRFFARAPDDAPWPLPV
jgi:hypothetical protein